MSNSCFSQVILYFPFSPYFSVISLDFALSRLIQIATQNMPAVISPSTWMSLYSLFNSVKEFIDLKKEPLLIICIDLENKNLVSVELNLPSCLQVKKRKTWMISLCLPFKEVEFVNSGNRLVSEPHQQGHRDSENGPGADMQLAGSMDGWSIYLAWHTLCWCEYWVDGI